MLIRLLAQQTLKWYELVIVQRCSSDSAGISSQTLQWYIKVLLHPVVHCFQVVRRKCLFMTDAGSVTQWLNDYRDGDDSALHELWKRYWTRIRGLAKRQLGGARLRSADEEDAALAAFSDFCLGVREDRFSELDDREDLWQILALLTRRKAISLYRKSRRAELGESVLSAGSESEGPGIGNVASGETPDPASWIQAMDEFRRLMMLLPDDQTRQIAQLRLEGWSNLEISDKAGCALRTVERRIGQIRELWSSCEFFSKGGRRKNSCDETDGSS